jgi:hypothetical protein
MKKLFILLPIILLWFNNLFCVQIDYPLGIVSGGSGTVSPIYTSTIQALTSGGISVLTSSGASCATFDGGGSACITTGTLSSNLLQTRKLSAANAHGLALTDDSQATANGLFVADGGNVGVASANPTQKFSVNGISRLIGAVNIVGDINLNGNCIIPNNKFFGSSANKIQTSVSGVYIYTNTTRENMTLVSSTGFVGVNSPNPQRQFSVIGDVQVTGNIYESNSAWAEIYVSYNATATKVLAAGSYVTVTDNVLSDDLRNFTFTSASNDVYLTCGVAGTYQFCLSMSFSGGANDEFHGGVSVNGANPSGKHEFSRKMGAAGDVGSAGTTGIITLAVNDTVRVKITNETNADDPTIKNMNFNIRRIAP